MYCIFKMDKNPISTSFITASKICSTKQIYLEIFQFFKPINSQTQNFHKNATLSTYEKLCVTKCWPHHSFIKEDKWEKRAKSITAYNFSAL